MARQLKLTPQLNQRERSQVGPRDQKRVGSPEWCWQTIDLLKIRWEKMSDDEREFERTLEELKQARAWERVPPDEPYGSLERLIESEIGKPAEQISAKIREVGELRRQGRPTTEERENKGNNITFIRRRGTSPEYLTARIARDRPDILERMKSGEFRSVRAAALAAGLVAMRISIPLDAQKAAAAIKRHFSPEQVAEILRLLEGERRTR